MERKGRAGHEHRPHGGCSRPSLATATRCPPRPGLLVGSPLPSLKPTPTRLTLKFPVSGDRHSRWTSWSLLEGMLAMALRGAGLFQLPHARLSLAPAASPGPHRACVDSP